MGRRLVVVGQRVFVDRALTEVRGPRRSRGIVVGPVDQRVVPHRHRLGVCRRLGQSHPQRVDTVVVDRAVQAGEQRAGVGRPGPGSRRVARAPGVEHGRQALDALDGAGLVVYVLPGHLHRLVAVVRHPAGEHLEQHDAGRVDVGARVGVPVGDQLRRHVRDGRHELRRSRRAAAGLDRAGQAEVGHLATLSTRLAAAAGRLGDQHVLRLDVAVHQAGPVRGGDRGEHLLQDRQRLDRVEPAALGEQVAQGAALHVLHHQVGQALVAALVVDGDHVGVGEPGDRLRLVGEPVDEVGSSAATGG